MDTSPIASFEGEYRFLSNFTNCQVIYNGLTYPSTENAYQAAKCSLIDDRFLFINVSAGEAKRLGRTVAVRNDWDKIKDDVMQEVTDRKYEHPEFAKLLLATGERHISEGNNWGDEYWGVNLRTGVGQNRLGRMLMKKRGELETYVPYSILTK